MQALALSLRLPAVALLALAFVLPHSAMAQPLRAELFFKTPPPDGTFGPNDPIGLILQVCNAARTPCTTDVSGAPLTTTAGFSREEHWRFLFFARPFAGGTVTNTAEVHNEVFPRYCFVRGGILQRPTAIPVLPAETLPGIFAVQHTLDDARTAGYPLGSGRYVVNAQIPFHTFTSPAVITNCNDFPGQTLLNLLAPTGREVVTIISNSLQFVISRYNFVGFGTPLINDSVCGATVATPCRTFKLGSTVPVKFQLSDATGVVSTAVATIRVKQVSGSPPPTTPEDLGTGAADTGNHFRFDPTGGQYIFNLNTKVLTAGVWRVEAQLDDGGAHAVLIGLR